MLKTLAIAILVAIGGFAIYVALQPSLGSVTRTAVLPAKPEAIFANVNDLHRFQEWSPWAKLDPNAKTSFEGPASGTGSVFTWSGNNDVGEGKMTIVGSRPNEEVNIKLDFAKPFTSTSMARFALKPEGEGTRATWSMSGERPYLARAMCILFNADKMVGDMFEKGLAELGRVSSASH